MKSRPLSSELDEYLSNEAITHRVLLINKSQGNVKRIINKKYFSILLKRLAYFMILYSVVFSFALGFLNWYIYFQVPRDYPKLSGMQSRLNLNPGLSHVPNPSAYTSLIRFRPHERLYYEKTMDEMISFLHRYHRSVISDKMRDCVLDKDTVDAEHPCIYNLNAGGDCNIKNDFGYETARPCFALKINKIYGWVPEIVDFATGVLVKCEGATDADTRHLGTIRYYDMDYKFSPIPPGHPPPKHENGSFHSMYFPYLNQRDYHQPIVFVMFDGTTRNILIRVKCYLIAKNIIVDMARREGSTSFEILID